jgi:putative membrane protein
MPRSTTRFVFSGFALLALAACAMQSPPAPPVAAAPPPPPVPAPTVAAPAFSDQDFVSRAVAGTALEVETGRLARTQAASPSVRAFGRQIAYEHARLHYQVLAIAQQEGVMPNAAPPNPGQLAALTGPEFDRQYMANQVDTLQQAIALFESEVQSGQDSRLRNVAARTLPALHRDLARAQAIAARMGA